MDVYPTLCELTGITPPDYIHGESLTTVMENPSVNLKDEIYTRYKQGEAVVDENYSYTEFFQGEEYLGNMLYDLKVDLRQNIDISKQIWIDTSFYGHNVHEVQRNLKLTSLNIIHN